MKWNTHCLLYLLLLQIYHSLTKPDNTFVVGAANVICDPYNFTAPIGQNHPFGQGHDFPGINVSSALNKMNDPLSHLGVLFTSIFMITSTSMLLHHYTSKADLEFNINLDLSYIHHILFKTEALDMKITPSIFIYIVNNKSSLLNITLRPERNSHCSLAF